MSLIANSMAIEISTMHGTESVMLFPERAVYWCSQKTLMVADLHWGKPETFRSYGIPIPSGILEEDLGRLNRVIEKTAAERLVVLGDLIHGKRGMTETLIDRIAEWRNQQSLEMILIRGNHDRHYRELPRSWEIMVVEEEWTEGPFVFSHHPNPSTGHFVWAGHVHPTVIIRGNRDRLRFQCFHIMDSVGVLPAFSIFTGGFNIQKQASERVIAIVDSDLVEV